MNIDFDVVHKGAFGLANYWFDYTIIKEANNVTGFDLISCRYLWFT